MKYYTIRCKQQTSNSCSVETSEHRKRAHQTRSTHFQMRVTHTHPGVGWWKLCHISKKAFKSCGARCPKNRKFISQFQARSCWLKASRVVRPLILFIFLWSMWYFIAKTLRPWWVRFYQNIFWCAHSCEADNEWTNILKLGFLLWWTQNAKECFLLRQDIGICENLQCVQLLNT